MYNYNKYITFWKWWMYISHAHRKPKFRTWIIYLATGRYNTRQVIRSCAHVHASTRPCVWAGAVQPVWQMAVVFTHLSSHVRHAFQEMCWCEHQGNISHNRNYPSCRRYFHHHAVYTRLAPGTIALHLFKRLGREGHFHIPRNSWSEPLLVLSPWSHLK